MAWWRRSPDPQTSAPQEFPQPDRPAELGIPGEVQALTAGRALVAFGPPGRTAWAYRVSADEQLEEWRRLKGLHSESGWYPILLGDDVPGEDYYGDPVEGEELEEAVRRDPLKWLAEHYPEAEDDIDEGDEKELSDEDPPYSVEGQDGWIGLVRARHSWEVPAVLGWYGPANHDIDPEDHPALLRYWEEEYAAELVVLGADTMELCVGRPPGSREMARLLALQQYRYCPDVVEQGTGTLQALVAGLVQARHWQLWWD